MPAQTTATSTAPADDDTNARLRRRVSDAVTRVPFYTKRFADAGISAADIRGVSDLPRIPLLSKEEIIADQAANPPAGDLGTVTDLGRIHVIASTYYLYLSHGDLTQLTRMFAEGFATLGVRSTDVVDIASAFHWVVAGTQMDPAIRSIGAAVVPSGPGQSELRLRVIRETGVSVLQAFTPYAEELATRLVEDGVDPADLLMRLLIVGGELRDSAAKQRLEQAWGGAAVRELYGVSEAGMVASECFEVGDGMHVGRHAVVEVIDPDSGEQVPLGTPGEVVTTELYRSAQPFIRYRTGDITEGLDARPCACGRTSYRLGRIIGRNGNIPRVKGLFIPPARVAQTLARIPGAGPWQIEIDRPGTGDRMTVRVEWSEPAGTHQAATDAVAQALKEAIGIRCEIDLVAPGHLGMDAPRVLDLRDLR